MEVLDIKEAAKLLGFRHPGSLRRKLRQSPELGIPYFRIGTGKPRFRFVKEKLEQWILSQKIRRVEARDYK